MQKVDVKSCYRIIDANINRAKEGLRVCEDVCRFVFNQKRQTRKWKNLRHRLTSIISSFDVREVIGSRNVRADVGRQTMNIELKRNKVMDIFCANAQRAKESIRVLEEFAKLLNKKRAQDLKKIRYQVYALEKEIIEGC